MANSYRLPRIVLEASSSKTWDAAVSEWHVVGCRDNGMLPEIAFVGTRALGTSLRLEIPLTGKSSPQ